VTDPVIIREIEIADWLDRAAELYCDHAAELAEFPELNPEEHPPEPLAPVYVEMSRLGLLVALGAFRGEELVGYCVAFLSKHPHYRDLVVAQCDVLYVSPTARGATGLRLKAHMERIAIQRGAAVMLWTARPGSDLQAVLNAQGYRCQEIIYSKVL
jgi:predicted GNAT superfamily acetyltransferase